MPSFSNFLMNLKKLVLNPSVVHEVPLVVEQIVSRLCKSWLFKKVDNGGATGIETVLQSLALADDLDMPPNLFLGR